MPSKPPTHDAILRAQHPERYAAAKSDAAEYARRMSDEGSAKAAAVYNSARWVRLRRLHLQHEPLCRHCVAEDRTTAACDVNHIVAIRDGCNPYDEANLESLCRSHHSRVTAAERAARKAKT